MVCRYFVFILCLPCALMLNLVPAQFPPGRLRTRLPMSLTAEQQAEIAAARRRPTRRATVPALEARLGAAHPRPRPRLHPRRRLHGRRRRHRPGRPRLLRRRHQDRPRRRRPHPLPDAPLALDPLRDVRDQAAREAPGLRRPPVDPPPHRQRQRILRPLLDPRPRVLHPRPRPPRRPVPRQQPGPRRDPRGPTRPPASSPSSAPTPTPPTTTTRPCSPPRASRASPASSPA